MGMEGGCKCRFRCLVGGKLCIHKERIKCVYVLPF